MAQDRQNFYLKEGFQRDGRAQVSIGKVHNVMIGNNSKMIVTNSSSNPAQFSVNAKEIKAHHPLTTCKQPLSLDQKMAIKDRVGAQWKDLGRRLGFIEPELEQLLMDNKDNCSEIVYQILIKWHQRFDDQATQESLAVVFHKMKRGDLSDLLWHS